MNAHSYDNAEAVGQAMSQAARNADGSTQDRLRQAVFDRFLSRVFFDPEGDWVLKGGTGLLARVEHTRATQDVDLLHAGGQLDEARQDLYRAAAIDLGDFYTFTPTKTRPSIEGDNQPYVEGERVSFAVALGDKQQSRLNVDLVVQPFQTRSATWVTPENRLHLPRLQSHDYRVYPVEAQIADKMWACMETHNDRPSSREKDLVDLVVIANTQTVDQAELARSIKSEGKRRHQPTPTSFNVPDTWGKRYQDLAAPIPACQDHRTVEKATQLVKTMIDPALSQQHKPATWTPGSRQWVTMSDAERLQRVNQSLAQLASKTNDSRRVSTSDHTGSNPQAHTGQTPEQETLRWDEQQAYKQPRHHPKH